MNPIKNLILTEPVLVAGVIEAAIVLVAAFGLSLSGDQIAAIMGFTSMFLAAVARAFTTPAAEVALTHEDVQFLEEAGFGS